jgi:hypothetical protein
LLQNFTDFISLGKHSHPLIHVPPVLNICSNGSNKKNLVEDRAEKARLITFTICTSHFFVKIGHLYRRGANIIS